MTDPLAPPAWKVNPMPGKTIRSFDGKPSGLDPLVALRPTDTEAPK